MVNWITVEQEEGYCWMECDMVDESSYSLLYENNDRFYVEKFTLDKHHLVDSVREFGKLFHGVDVLINGKSFYGYNLYGYDVAAMSYRWDQEYRLILEYFYRLIISKFGEDHGINFLKIEIHNQR